MTIYQWEFLPFFKYIGIRIKYHNVYVCTLNLQESIATIPADFGDSALDYILYSISDTLMYRILTAFILQQHNLHIYFDIFSCTPKDKQINLKHFDREMYNDHANNIV